MDTTKYLKELQKQGKLPELLKKLGLPNKEVDTANHKCKIYFLSDSLYINSWQARGPENCFEESSFFELNDYMFISGVRDPDQKKLQTLFDYMRQHFDGKVNETETANTDEEQDEDPYLHDCIKFLNELRAQKHDAIDQEAGQKKQAVDDEMATRVLRVNQMYNK